MSAIERAWREGGALATALRPLGALHGALGALRAAGYRRGRPRVLPSALPVLVVGNVSVGGTGKTPLTARLVAELRERGWRPGIVSRGYGGARHDRPRHVRADDAARDVGDEPLMLHRATGAPVCVCARRALAVAALARDTDCDVVLSDDGLQHLAMARDAEIVVVDAERGFGNGRLLPAGPLRERPARLLGADLVALREATPAALGAPRAPDAPLASVPGAAALGAGALPPVLRFALGRAHIARWPDGARVPLASLAGRAVNAVAGIARPERFFDTLRAHGLDVVDARALPDHHPLAAADLAFGAARPVLVTTKDAARLDGVAPLPDALHVVDVGVETAAGAAALLDALDARLRAAARARAAGGAAGGAVDGIADTTEGARR